MTTLPAPDFTDVKYWVISNPHSTAYLGRTSINGPLTWGDYATSSTFTNPDDAWMTAMASLSPDEFVITPVYRY